MTTLHNPTDINPPEASRSHWKALTLAVAISVVTLAAAAILHAF